MKKRWVLGLGTTVLAIGLAGCGQLPQDTSAANTNTKEESKSVSSSLSKSDDGKLEPEEGASLRFRTGDEEFGNAVAKLFEEKYKVPVKVEEGNSLDFTKDVMEAASGEGPDVFMSPHDKTLEGIQAGIFTELDPSLVESLESDISDVAMKTVTVDDKVYGVPVSIETNVMFYNKSVLKDKPASTFDELKKEAEEFNNQKENKFIYLSDVTTGSPIYPMLGTYGFRLFGENGTDEDHPGFDTPEFEKGLEVLADYHNIMPISSGDLSNADFLTNQFTEGKTGYLLGGPWNVKTFREAGVDFGVTNLVTYDGHEQKPFAFVQNAHVSAYTKYPKTAQLFAEFLVSPESAELLYSKAFKITSRSDITSVDGLKEDKELTAIAKVFEKSIPMPSAQRISAYWTITSNIGPAVFDQQMTPKEGAKKAQEDWDAFLQTE